MKEEVVFSRSRRNTSAPLRSSMIAHGVPLRARGWDDSSGENTRTPWPADAGSLRSGYHDSGCSARGNSFRRMCERLIAFVSPTSDISARGNRSAPDESSARPDITNPNRPVRERYSSIDFQKNNPATRFDRSPCREDQFDKPEQMGHF